MFSIFARDMIFFLGISTFFGGAGFSTAIDFGGGFGALGFAGAAPLPTAFAGAGLAALFEGGATFGAALDAFAAAFTGGDFVGVAFAGADFFAGGGLAFAFAVFAGAFFVIRASSEAD